MMESRAIATFVLALVLIAAESASAETEVELLRARVQQLELQQKQTLAALDSLRARLDERDGGSDPAAPSGTTRAAEDVTEAEIDLDTLAGDEPLLQRVDFHGHLAAAYFGFEERSVAPDGETSPSLSDRNPQSSFSLSDLSFFVGLPLYDNLYVATEIEYEQGGDQIDVDQAFIQWDLRQEDPISLRLGKFYVPFGIERYFQNAPTNPLVDRPAPFVHIIPGTYSETGLYLHGESTLLEGPEIVGEYEIAWMNGLGAPLFLSTRSARQNVDNNARKAIGGRLGVAYDRWLQLGASILSSKYDDRDDDYYLYLGADARARWGPFFLRGEYVYSRVDNPEAVDADGVACSLPCSGLTPPITPLGGRFNREGWYVEGTYRHRPTFLGELRDLEYVLRFDELDEDDSVRDLLDARRVSMGVVYRPYDHFRLKVQYEVIDEEGDEFDNNAFLLEGSVDW